jgi:hypothetical protein
MHAHQRASWFSIPTAEKGQLQKQRSTEKNTSCKALRTGYV